MFSKRAKDSMHTLVVYVCGVLIIFIIRMKTSILLLDFAARVMNSEGQPTQYPREGRMGLR